MSGGGAWVSAPAQAAPSHRRCWSSARAAGLTCRQVPLAVLMHSEADVAARRGGSAGILHALHPGVVVAGALVRQRELPLPLLDAQHVPQQQQVGLLLVRGIATEGEAKLQALQRRQPSSRGNEGEVQEGGCRVSTSGRRGHASGALLRAAAEGDDSQACKAGDGIRKRLRIKVGAGRTRGEGGWLGGREC